MNNRTILGGAVSLTASLVCFTIFGVHPATAQPVATEEVELYDYVVKRGDTCAGIARREFGDSKAYRNIHRHNNRMGPVPHRLKVGSILRLPTATRTPDAILDGRQGQVQYRRAAEPSWDAAKLGMDLFRAWRVWSQEKSTAVVVFRDKSVISMRDNTVMVIYGPTSGGKKRRATRAQLESGALRTRLAALEGRLLVETESSTMKLEGGSAVLSANKEEGRATVSNHEGTSVAVRSRKKRSAKPVAVAPGKGTWIKRGQAPAPPRDLPAAPAFATAPRISLGLAHQGVTIVGTWNTVVAAEKYRVEIATDPNVRIVVAAFEVDKTVTSFEARGLKPGDYYLSVASIDDEGLESAPSPRRLAQALALEKIGPAGQRYPAAVAEGGPAGPTRVELGSVLSAPEGYSCSMGGDATPTSELKLRAIGAAKVACTDRDGNLSAPMELVVEGPTLTTASESQAWGIRRGAPSNLQIETTTPLPLGVTWRATGPAGVEAVVTAASDRALAIKLEVGPNAPAQFELAIIQVTAAGPIQLSTLAVEVMKDPIIVDDPPRAASASPVRLAVLMGVFDSTLEEDSRADSTAPFVGARASWIMSPRWGVEGAAVLSRRFDDDPHWFASNQIVGTLTERLNSDWQLRARVGPVLWLNEDPDSERSARLGSVISLGAERGLRRGSLRVDLNGYAFATVTNRMGLSLSYQWDPI